MAYNLCVNSSNDYYSMGRRFRDWLACPECGSRDVSMMAHHKDVSLECYRCETTSVYTIGEDTSLNNLDTETIEDVSRETTDD